MTMPTIKMTPPGKERGFTLIELMVAVLVLGILTSAAIPSFKSFITNQRIKTASFDMMALITFTRSEAIKRNANVTLNGNASILTVTAGGVTLRQQEMFKGIQLDCIDLVTHTSTPCGAGIIYNGNGRLVSAFGPLQLGILNAGTVGQDTTDPYFRCISIDLSGRPNSKKGKC